VEIEGKVAVVVGGASGMARAAAELLAERGAQIAICDLPSSNGAEVAKGIGGSTTFHEIDVMDYEGAERVLDEAVAQHGALHILINTAGGGVAPRAGRVG
jgi:NAD(P)-dependent dehydrogenase (short-subunit alcohol dehydrogenase family)